MQDIFSCIKWKDTIESKYERTGEESWERGAGEGAGRRGERCRLSCR